MVLVSALGFLGGVVVREGLKADAATVLVLVLDLPFRGDPPPSRLRAALHDVEHVLSGGWRARLRGLSGYVEPGMDATFNVRYLQYNGTWFVDAQRDFCTQPKRKCLYFCN